MYIVYVSCSAFSQVQTFLSSRNFKKTPRVSLGLTSGELVKVKRKDDIVATLDSVGRNRVTGSATK